MFTGEPSMSDVLEMPIGILLAFKLSPSAVDSLHCFGYSLVQDISNISSIDRTRFTTTDYNILTSLSTQVTLSILARDIFRDTVPVRNTFIDYPAPPGLVRSVSLSCPAVFESPLSTPTSTSFTSLGSTDHQGGLCKPCAWYHSDKGCRQGHECEFCHLCTAGEIKRRKKDKLALLKFLKSNRKNFTPQYQ